jgi:hypothetical protein
MRALLSGQRGLFFLLVAATAGLGSGCAKRFHLTPAELERVQTEAGVNPLRVYVSHRMLAIYDEAAVAEQYDVNRKIVEGSKKERVAKDTRKNDGGLILKIDELNGKPLLWVTFDPGCNVPDCAYGFVETEDKLYRLISVPPIEGYAPPKVNRSCKSKKKRMAKGKLSSLAEANEVYVLKKRNGKILTIALHVKKVVDDRVTTKTQRSRGIR